LSASEASSHRLGRLEVHWLAELVRRHETRHGPLDDDDANAQARKAGPDFGARVLQRAALLGARMGWCDAVVRWHGRARMLLALALLLALLAGFAAAAGVLGDGGRPINVVWAVGGLLGVHVLSLLLWLFGLGLQGRMGGGPGRGGLLGRAWLRLVGVLDRSHAAADLPAALGSLLARGRLAAWGIGAVSHALWLAALLGAALGVLVLLATRRYGFVWETTILPAHTFISLSAALGALPAAIGFPVPDAALVAASGDAPMLEEAGRRAWAGWLLGAVVVYGVLPRLALALLCAGLWQRGLGRIGLDVSLPGYARLRPLLMPDSLRIGVSDPEPARMPRPQRHAAAASAADDVIAVALELGEDLDWPPQRSGMPWQDGGRIDSREQRRTLLERLAARPPARLLVAVDARQTPDRGSLGLVADLAGRSAAIKVWARTAGRPAARLPQWRDGLARLGLDGALVEDEAAALAWLEQAGGEG